MIFSKKWIITGKYSVIFGCILILQLSFLGVAGQKKIDTIGLQSTYPFDEEFILKFPIQKNDSILYAYIFELKHGCIKNSVCPDCKKKTLSFLFPGSAKALRDSVVKKKQTPDSKDIATVIKDLNLTGTEYFLAYKMDTIISQLRKVMPVIPGFVKHESDSLMQSLLKLKSILRAQVNPSDLKKTCESLAEEIFVKLGANDSQDAKLVIFKSIVEKLQNESFVEDYPSPNKLKFDSLLNVLKKDTLKTLVRYINELEEYIDSMANKTKSPLKLEIAKQDSLNAYIKMASLQPEKEYFLIMTGRIVINGIDQIIETLVNGDLAKAKELYTKAAMKQGKKLSTNADGECKDCGYLNFELLPFEVFFNYFLSQNISKLYLQIEANELRFSEIKLKLDNITDVRINPVLLREIVKRSKECDRCKDSLFKYQWFDKPPQNLISSITHFSRLSDTVFSHGYADLDFMGPAVAGKVKNEQRIINLKKTIETVDMVISLLDNYQNEESITGYLSFRNQLAGARSVLFNNLIALSTFEETKKILQGRIDKDKEDLRAVFLKFPGFTVPISAFATSTYTWGFEGRTGFAVKADFGFMAYGDFWNDRDFFGVRPYLGFHVNFRPLNSEVPWNKIKGWKKYFSFTGGALIGTIKEEGKREGLIGNTSIFTGLGVALGHGLRITPGVVWYNRLDPNPLITSKKIGVTPYVGLSMDFRIQDVYNSFINLF